MVNQNVFTKNNQIYCNLNNGNEMPLLGLGCWDMYNAEAQQAVEWALEIGYRLIDTAAMYKNEVEVGNAIRNAGIERKEVFLTTKIDNADQGFEATLKAFEVCEQKLNCEYIDLLLMHWPIKGKRHETWKALEKLYNEGKVKAIGVANYLLPFLKEAESYFDIIPAVNQIEFSPYLFLENELNYCHSKGIRLQGYSPIVRGERFKDPKLVELANKYDKSPAQLLIRWQLELGVSVIPKSANYKRLKENFAVFDFNISDEDLVLMNRFNENLRVVDNPMDMF